MRLCETCRLAFNKVIEKKTTGPDGHIGDFQLCDECKEKTPDRFFINQDGKIHGRITNHF